MVTGIVVRGDSGIGGWEGGVIGRGKGLNIGRSGFLSLLYKPYRSKYEYV